jgi:hypothetical protein
MTNRRGFFGVLAAAIAGATLDPERLLWEPGKKLISIPKPVMVQVHTRAEGLGFLGFSWTQTMTLEEFRRRYPASARALENPRRYASNFELFSTPPVREFCFHRDAFVPTSGRTPAR